MQDQADAELHVLVELSFGRVCIFARSKVFMQELRLLCKTEGFYARLHRRTIACVTLPRHLGEVAFMEDRIVVLKT